LGLLGWLSAAGAFAAEYRSLVHPQNMERLRCAMPDTTYRLAGSSAPGYLFYADEPVDVTLIFHEGKDAGTVRDFAIEIQEITMRLPEPADPARAGAADFGPPNLIRAEGKAVTHPLAVTFGAGPEATVAVKDLPVPKRLGTYALVLVRGPKRQFLGTVCRVPRPRPEGNADNTPISGEGAFFDDVPFYPQRAATYERMGIHSQRFELSWQETKEGKYLWDRYDSLFAACEAHKVQILVTLGGHPWHFLPFGEPTPAACWTPEIGGYWGTADWLAKPDLYPRYGRWITAFCQRYWKDGKGALWGLEHYNEPWEGGGISGWARDCLQYRELLKLIATSARKVDRRIKIAATSSIMNTEDKLYSDGSDDFDQYVDVFTDHYVIPPHAYGPMVARRHGKESMETESWIVNTEFRVPLGVCQFLACGQKRLDPWHPRDIFDTLPGTKGNYAIPTPTVAATAAFNYFVTGKPFEKIVFHDHLPWVFQFGKDDDKDALLVVFGQLLSITGKDPKDQVRQRLWAQVEAASGGTLTIDNRDGLLQFYDLAGNPTHEGEPSVTVPLSYLPTYIKCGKGPVAAAERLRQARIEGKRPVEILPRDFTTRLGAKGAALEVGVHNSLNRKIAGKLAVHAPEGIRLAASEQAVELAPGETKSLSFAVASAKLAPANSYPFTFAFASDAGNAEYAETINAAVAPKGTKTIDGNLDDWNDVPGVVLIAKTEKVDVTELARRPWLDVKDKLPDGTFAEVKLAWDDDYIYVAARVHDPTPQTDRERIEGRDENAFFHTAASDRKSPYKEFLAKHAGHSFAEVPFVYCKNPNTAQSSPYYGDRLQIGFDVRGDWHDLAPTTDRVPYGFHAVPDTDYEYSLYLCADGKSECWRLLAPGLPRMHDYPRQPRGKLSTGPLKKAKHVVRQDGKVRLYELAIPREEIPELKLRPGATFGFTFTVGNDKGPAIFYGEDKAVTKTNGLTLHPYWEPKPSCGVRWALVE
jgi:hypothetical protein